MKKGLVIVDMQNDFVSKTGALPVKDAPSIVSTIVNLHRLAYANNIPIIYTQDFHKENDEEFKVFHPHCIENTSGAEIISVLTPSNDDIVIKKNTFSAFKSTLESADAVLKDFDELYVVGVATDYCVSEFAIDARLRGKEVAVIVDAIKGVDEIPGVPGTLGSVVRASIRMGGAGVYALGFDDIVERKFSLA